jgi:preprotein translocase subunit SecD
LKGVECWVLSYPRRRSRKLVRRDGFDRRAAFVATGVIFAVLAGCGGGREQGVELTFHATGAPQRDATVLRARLARLGFDGATVRDQGDRLVVRAPGVDRAGAAPLARQMATASPLRFYDWEADVVGPGCRLDPQDTQTTGGDRAGSPAFGLTREDATRRAARCRGTIAVRARGVGSDRWYVLRDRPALTGAQIRHPVPFRDDGPSGTGESKVTFEFTPAGVRAWRALTRAVARRDRRTAAAGGDPQHVAVVLDDTLLSTPSVAYRDYPDGIDASFGSQVDGGLTLEAARAVAAVVARDTLPVPLALERVRVVG